MRAALKDEIDASIRGSYEIGGGVTMFDFSASSPLVHMHEQTHRDNVNNTLFGYWITRLADLGERPPAEGAKPANVLLSRAIQGAWDTMEGAATFTEFLNIICGAVTFDLNAWEAELPADYRRAFALYYRSLKGFARPYPDGDLQLLALSTLNHAVAETVLDGALHSLPALPASLADLTRAFARADLPRKLRRTLTAVHRIDIRGSMKHVENAQWLPDGSDGSRFVRGQVMAIKHALTAYLHPRSKVGMIHDRMHIDLRIAIDAELCRTIADLPPRPFVRRIIGGASTADLGAVSPTWQVARTRVAIGEVAERVRLEQAHPDTFAVGIVILRDPRSDSYTGGVIPIDLVEQENGQGIGLFRESAQFDGTPAEVQALSSELGAEGYFWITPLVVRGDETTAVPYDWEFLSGLAAPLFFFSSEFSEVALTALMAGFGRKPELYATSMRKGGHTFDVVWFKQENATLFWVCGGLVNDRARSMGWADVGGYRATLVPQPEEAALAAAICLVLSDLGKDE
ncbi:MAG TPA: hypothetical protein VKQ27_10120 [Acetobacteraceae bacterium]|nr:hypothetical protein [Acetobacteraceae bacterium]